MVLGIVAVVTVLFAVTNNVGFGSALRASTVNAVSIITGTGYATAPFDTWGGFAATIFFLAMFVGGCAGSTTCGIKIFRFQVLYATAAAHISRLLHPHGVFIPTYNRRPISDEVALSVMSFFFFYVLVFVILAVLLGVTGLDFITALSGSATAISNVGPGLGDIVGPAGNFAELPGAAKWLLAVAMLMGRLELLTVFVLFTRTYWRG